MDSHRVTMACLVKSNSPAVPSYTQRRSTLQVPVAFSASQLPHRQRFTCVPTTHQLVSLAPCSSNKHPTRTHAAAHGCIGAGDSSYGSRNATVSLKSALEFLEAQYLPIALLSALALGALHPTPGLAAANMQIPAIATFGIFLVQVR